MTDSDSGDSSLALSEGRRTLDALVRISDRLSDDCIDVIKINLLLASIFAAIIQLDASISARALIAGAPLVVSVYYAITAYWSATKFVGSSDKAVAQLNQGTLSERKLANDYSIWIKRTGAMNEDLGKKLVYAWGLAFSSILAFVAIVLISA